MESTIVSKVSEIESNVHLRKSETSFSSWLDLFVLFARMNYNLYSCMFVYLSTLYPSVCLAVKLFTLFVYYVTYI